jgi:hypothetical protein
MFDVEVKAVSDTLITALVLSAAAGITFWAYRLFRRSTTDHLAAFIGALAVALGSMIAIAGLLHTTFVVSGAVRAQKPYDVRFAWLITTGALLMYTGVINAWLARAMKRGERSAMTASAAATIALLLFLAALHPASSQTILLLTHGGYIALVLFWLKRDRLTIAR